MLEQIADKLNKVGFTFIHESSRELIRDVVEYMSYGMASEFKPLRCEQESNNCYKITTFKQRQQELGDNVQLELSRNLNAEFLFNHFS